jgi:hypothetical protein
MDKKAKFKAGCGVAAVFGAGVLCGAIALFLIIIRVIPLAEGWKDEESREFVMNHLARQLDLTPEQIEEIQPIVEETLDLRYGHRKTYMKSDIELTGKSLERILPILSDPQKEKARKVFANWKKGKERFLGVAESEEIPGPATTDPAEIPEGASSN